MSDASLSSRHRVFVDPNTSDRFVRDGYAVVRLVDSQTADSLRQVCVDLGPAPGDQRDGLFNDTWSTDPDFRARVAEVLVGALGPPIERLLSLYRVLGLTRIAKWPGQKGAVVAHRDPSFVVEPQQISLGIWIALEDIDVNQGTMSVVPKSHLLAQGARPHQSELNLYPEIEVVQEQFATALPMRAGEALVYDHRLIHLSPPNNSTRVRTVIGGICVPNDATVTYPLSTQSSATQLVEIDSSFFVKNQLSQLDEAEVLASWPRAGQAQVTDGTLDLDELERLQAVQDADPGAAVIGPSCSE